VDSAAVVLKYAITAAKTALHNAQQESFPTCMRIGITTSDTVPQFSAMYGAMISWLTNADRCSRYQISVRPQFRYAAGCMPRQAGGGNLVSPSLP
jgi:hypothetical protein